MSLSQIKTADVKLIPATKAKTHSKLTDYLAILAIDELNNAKLEINSLKNECREFALKNQDAFEQGYQKGYDKAMNDVMRDMKKFKHEA